jgi:uncharacterized membrane protein
MEFDQVVLAIGQVVEGIGVAIILVGTVAVLVRSGMARLRRAPDADWYQLGRRGIGRALLLGLEVLVAGDIIRTVAVEPTLAAAVSLGIIVLIRTFLSWSIELETDGRWPWQQKQRSGS